MQPRDILRRRVDNIFVSVTDKKTDLCLLKGCPNKQQQQRDSNTWSGARNYGGDPTPLRMHEAVSYIVIVVDLPKGTGRRKLIKPHFLQTSKMLIFDRKTDCLQFLSSLKNDEVKSKFGKKTKHQQPWRWWWERSHFPRPIRQNFPLLYHLVTKPL